jgi:hypothetical protein
LSACHPTAHPARILEHLGYDPAQVIANYLQEHPQVLASTPHAQLLLLLQDLLRQESCAYRVHSSAVTWLTAARVPSLTPAGILPSPLPGALRALPSEALLPPVYDPAREVTESPQAVSVLHTLLNASLGGTLGDEGCSPLIRSVAVFSGLPPWRGDGAELFDSRQATDRCRLPEIAELERISVFFTPGSLPPDGLMQGMELQLFIGDLWAPRARLPLPHFLRDPHYPLALTLAPGASVRLVLVAPHEPVTCPELEVYLCWR